MPMEIVHFMQSDIVNVFFNKRHRKKMATAIEMHTPVLEAWIVVYGDVRNLYFRIARYGVNRQKLYQSLHAIKDAFLIVSADVDAFVIHRHFVSARQRLIQSVIIKSYNVATRRSFYGL